MKRPVKKTDGAHNHNYGFVFSSELKDWQQSKRLKANEHMREVYKKLKTK